MADEKITAQEQKFVDLAERAKAAVKRRKSAPMTTVNAALVVPHKDLVQQFAPDCITQVDGTGSRAKIRKPKNHAFWANEGDLERLAEDGYEVRFYPGTRKPVQTPGGSILTTIDNELYEQSLVAPRERAKNRLRETSADERDNPDVVHTDISATR